MNNEMPSSQRSLAVVQLIIYWSVVGVPLAWGVYKTYLKMGALFP